MLEAEGISKSFWGVQALDRARLSVRCGEIHALTGENGAGKSTLMRIVAGIERADAGEIRFRGRRIAMIHQELLAFPDLSVAANIGIGREAPWLNRRAMRSKARELLERLGMPIDPECRMGDLSFAEQQSVEIAKALGSEADLLIMDEPTSSLSAHESERLFELIFDLKSRGVAVIYISHRMQEIFRLADTITVMRDGRHVATKPATEFDESRLISLMVGREIQTMPPKAPLESGEVILEVRDLTSAKIGFQVRRGEILGLAGLIGAGRTRLANLIFGLAPMSGGTVFVKGRRVSIKSPADALAHGIAMVNEDRKEFGIVPNLSVKENLTLSSLGRYCRGPFLRRRVEETAAGEQIRNFDVRATGRDQPIKRLSGGNQQKIVLARALLTDPDVLILDEPTRGIDVGAKAEIYALIMRLAGQGKAILLISSEMNEMLALAHRILVMREGAVVAEVRPEQTSPEEILRHAMPN